jgi:hypothetical protein
MNTNKAVLINGIFCYDEAAPHEKLGRHVSEAERQIVCAWTNRIALGIFLAGGATVSGTVTTIVNPQTYPDIPWMYCHEVNITPVDGSKGRQQGTNSMVAYDYARLNCLYKAAEFDASGVEEGEEALDYGTDSQVLSQSKPCFKWSGGANLDVLGQPIVRFTVVHFSKTINNLPVIPRAAIQALTDNVNNATFLGAPAGQFLFKGAHSIKRFTVGGINNWSITYDFAYRSIDWRKHYNPDASAWQTVTYLNGDPLYVAGAFTTLGILGT